MKINLFVMLFVLSTNASASLISSYDFNNNLTDTLGNGVDLVSSGGTIGAGEYNFSNNQGLRLTSALQNTEEYGIEIRFKLSDSLSGYNKVIDFQDRTSDSGIYIKSGRVNLFPARIASAGSVTIDSYFTLGLSRTSDAYVDVFLNSVLLFTAYDGGHAVSALNILNFFQDDNLTKLESFSGSVDFIRIHEDSSTFGNTPSAVPIPAAIWLFGSGLIGLFGRKKMARLSAKYA